MSRRDRRRRERRGPRTGRPARPTIGRSTAWPTSSIPALIAKLGASGLGEIEVREGDWRIRLRRPEGSGPVGGRRVEGRAGRTGSRDRRATTETGSVRPELTPVGPGRGEDHPIARCHSGRRLRRRRAPGPRSRPLPGRGHLAGGGLLPADGPGRSPAPGSGPATRSARSTSSACRPRSWRPPTASSARAWWSRVRPSSTARSWSGWSSCRRRRRRSTAHRTRAER